MVGHHRKSYKGRQKGKPILMILTIRGSFNSQAINRNIEIDGCTCVWHVARGMWHRCIAGNSTHCNLPLCITLSISIPTATTSAAAAATRVGCNTRRAVATSVAATVATAAALLILIPQIRPAARTIWLAHVTHDSRVATTITIAANGRCGDLCAPIPVGTVADQVAAGGGGGGMRLDAFAIVERVRTGTTVIVIAGKVIATPRIIEARLSPGGVGRDETSRDGTERSGRKTKRQSWVRFACSC